MQRHVRGDPVQEFRLFGGFRAPAGVSAQHGQNEPRRQILGLELAEEVPALPDAYGLEHGVPELSGMRRDELRRDADPRRLIEAGLHEVPKARNVHAPGADHEAALPIGIVEYVQVDVRCYGVGQALQGVKLARLYEAEVTRTEPVPAPLDVCDHLPLLNVHDEVIQQTPSGRVPCGSYRNAGVTYVRYYRTFHGESSSLAPIPTISVSVFYNNLGCVSNDSSSHVA